MGDYQVLFSGEVCREADSEQVRTRLARELGIDERKARQLFTGRTVVIKSQLPELEARTLQQRLETIGALCRVKSLAARAATPSIDKDALRLEGQHDRTLHDITAAHIECPRCSHLQLETSHCARCGVDIAAATAQKRKEDLLIEKKIRELRGGRPTVAAVTLSEPPQSGPLQTKKTGFMRGLFRRS